MGDDDLGLIEAFQKQGLMMHKPSALTPRRGLFSRSYTGTSIVLGLVSLESKRYLTFAILYLTTRKLVLPATPSLVDMEQFPCDFSSFNI